MGLMRMIIQVSGCSQQVSHLDRSQGSIEAENSINKATARNKGSRGGDWFTRNEWRPPMHLPWQVLHRD